MSRRRPSLTARAAPGSWACALAFGVALVGACGAPTYPGLGGEARIDAGAGGSGSRGSPGSPASEDAGSGGTGAGGGGGSSGGPSLDAGAPGSPPADDASRAPDDALAPPLDAAAEAPAPPPPLSSDPTAVRCYDSASKSPTTCTLPEEQCCGTLSGIAYLWRCKRGACGGLLPRVYACDEKADCGTDEICCADVFLGGIVGGRCGNDCGIFGDPQLCMTDAECGARRCVPKTAADPKISIGVCQ